MTRILIIGGGFGGLVTARRLSSELGPEHQVTVVSPRKEFTFYPGLVRLAFDECEVDDISFDLALSLRELGVRFVQGEMAGIFPETKEVEITGEDINGRIAYDYLVLAPGRRLAGDMVPGLFEHAHHILGVKAARRFGEAVNSFTEGKIVIGMCPGSRLPVPVCETAFALAKRFESGMADGKINVSVIFPESLTAAFGGADLHTELEAAFTSRGINVHYDIPISEVTPDHIISTEKHEIEYDLLMLVPPFCGIDRLRPLRITDELDFVNVDRTQRVKNAEKMYAVGDIVAFPGPKLGHMAVRQAETAAANIISEINGEAPSEEYEHEIATIIDSGGRESVFLRYDIWDESVHSVKQGRFWSWAKEAHDTYWQYRNK